MQELMWHWFRFEMGLICVAAVAGQRTASRIDRKGQR